MKAAFRYCVRSVVVAQRRPTGNRRLQHASPSPKKLDVHALLLSRQAWSVRSLLPSDHSKSGEAQIDSSQLHHLLRLSALPLPKTLKEEAQMIKTLQSQLHFVRDIQSVNTAGVEPLRSLRDETEEGMKEATIGLEQLRDALANETGHGHSRRPRMQKKEIDAHSNEDWDVLGTASEKASRYFVVRTTSSSEGTGYSSCASPLRE